MKASELRKDMMGNTLYPGDTFVYAALQNRSVGMRIGKVLADGSLRIAAQGSVRTPEGTWVRGWAAMRGRPSFDQLIKVPDGYLTRQAREALE